MSCGFGVDIQLDPCLVMGSFEGRFGDLAELAFGVIQDLAARLAENVATVKIKISPPEL